MPFEPGAKYNFQSVYTGQYMYGWTGISFSSDTPIDHDYNRYEFIPYTGSQYQIRNCATGAYFMAESYVNGADVWQIRFVNDATPAQSAWWIEETYPGSGTGELVKYEPSTGRKLNLHNDRGFNAAPAERISNPTTKLWRWIKVPEPTPSPTPVPNPPQNPVPNPPQNPVPNPPQTPASQTGQTSTHGGTTPGVNPPQTRGPVPPILAGINITGSVTTSTPEPFKGLYFDIYRGVARLSVRPSGPKFQHVVAIKVLRPGFDARTAAQTRTDFEALLNSCISQWSKLENDHLVPLIGISMAYGPFPATISSWMLNGLLTEYLSSNQRSDSEKMKLIIGVAKGIAYLHSEDIVHSDIRASSVLVDELGNARLTDPGLLGVLSKSPLLANVKLSDSYRWMAPEILVDPLAKATEASDIFAFTMTSLEIWTEKPPYDGVVDPLVPNLILQGQSPNQPGSVHAPLWTLWVIGWDKDPGKRLLMLDHVQRLEAM